MAQDNWAMFEVVLGVTEHSVVKITSFIIESERTLKVEFTIK